VEYNKKNQDPKKFTRLGKDIFRNVINKTDSHEVHMYKFRRNSKVHTDGDRGLVPFYTASSPKNL